MVYMRHRTSANYSLVMCMNAGYILYCPKRTMLLELRKLVLKVIDLFSLWPWKGMCESENVALTVHIYFCFTTEQNEAFIFISLSVVTTVSQRALQTLLWPQITPTFIFNPVFPARSHDLPQTHNSWVTSPHPPRSIPQNTCSDLVCGSSFNVQHCSSLHPCTRLLNMSWLWTRAMCCCSSFPHLQIKFYIVGDDLRILISCIIPVVLYRLF